MNKKIFQISAIEVEQFATFPIPETDSKLVQFDVNLDLNLNEEKRHINCSFNVTLRLLDEVIVKLQVKCAYLIYQEVWDTWVDSEYPKPNIPIDTIENIADQTMATARGILYVKTENTKYSTFFIPVLDLKDAITATQ